MQEEPALTLPPEEQELVKSTYRRSKCILEYGSGGSTVFAARECNCKCFSVESDKQWSAGLSSYLDLHFPKHEVKLHHSNIGDTTKWGYPSSRSRLLWYKFLRYSHSVWDRKDFEYPDTILIDGRFRVACFLATMSNIRKPATILFDDYEPRCEYHVVEQFFKPTRIVGRMAEFQVNPRSLSASERLNLWRVFVDPSQ